MEQTKSIVMKDAPRYENTRIKMEKKSIMNRRLKLFCAFAALISMNLCFFGNSTDSYYPLKEGMNWEYQFLIKTLLANVGGQKMVITNFAPREMNGKTVTPQKVDVLGQSSFAYIGQDDNGIFEFAKQLPNAIDPEINESPQYLLKYPIQAGISWVGEYKTNLLDSSFLIPLNNTIEAIDEIITVPVGTFKNCLRVKSIGSIEKNLGAFQGKARIVVESYSWYAPGVGMIKTITQEKCNHLMIGQGGTVSIQLESYKMQ